MLTWRSLRPIIAAAIISSFFVALAPAVGAPPLKKAALAKAAPVVSAEPQVKAPTAVLMDVDTGRILYSKNPHMRLPNASTTKIMTAILLIEHSKPTDKIVASKNVAETQHTSLHLKAGESITAKDLLTGMLVRSANDAAVAVAEYVAGDCQKFSRMMNRKAKRIGCTDTHFISPNGLYVPGHHTSACDLCLMARYAFRYPSFNEAIRTTKYFLESRSMNKEDLAVFTHSKFLKEYPGADGVKSGYTKQAKRCYVGSATRDGWRLVSAVLGSSNACDDTVALMDYGFGSFQLVPVVEANEKCADAKVDGAWHATVPAVAEKALKVPVSKKGGAVTKQVELLPVRAPIRKGAKLGKLKALVDGKEVAAVTLIAGEDDGISLGRRLWIGAKWLGLIVIGILGVAYVGTIAKGAGRRGRRLPPSMRRYDRGR